MKKRKSIGSMSLGSSILLLVFVVVSLVSFAVLSLSSAITDKKLTTQISKKNSNYYQACNLAEEYLAQIDLNLQTAYESSISQEGFYELVSTGSNFSIPVSDFQELYVAITYTYPQEEGDTFYTIDEWKLVNTTTPEIDNTLPLMQSEPPA